jgi:predicted PurR-regulated permease PerM
MNNESANESKQLERRLAAGVLLLLLLGCYLVVRPFLSALLWAVVLSFSLWPIQRRVAGWLGHRRTLAALVTTLGMALLLVLPFVVIGLSLSEDIRAFGTATRKLVETGPPPPPGWLSKIPLVGKQATVYWGELSEEADQWLERVKQAAETTHSVSTNGVLGSMSPTELPKQGEPILSPQTSKLAAALGKLIASARTWLVKSALAFGQGVLEVILSAILTFFFLRDGTAAAERLTAAVRRLGGERGTYLLKVAGDTVRGVVYGILGTAVVQGVVAGIGFLIAGVPAAALLALLTFFLSAVPVGPPLVWIPAAVWLFQQGSVGWGIFMIAWGLMVSSVDNFVKPWLISQGSKMPFLLIFFGVLGGALAFGFIGVFLGPTLLAVAYRLIQEWLAEASAAKPGSGTVAPAV